ncbi:MAG: thioesterase family protein [Phycisphaerae bacterium]
MNSECTLPIRVRYVECDPMGYLHHSAYLPYFEIGRTELLRQSGINYRDLEEQGLYFVVAKITVNFKKPARYDDELELVTKITRITNVRIEHDYELYEKESHLLLCTAQTTLACVGRDGQIQQIPESLFGGETP